MIEDGFATYVTQGLASLTPPLSINGFASQLPPEYIGEDAGQVTQAWMYRSITSDPSYNLQTETEWTEWTVEIQCHGTTMALAIALATAIKSVLKGGFIGKFPDPQQTVVFGLYRLPTQVDGFSDANRSYVRSLEFRIQYLQA